MRKVEEFKLQNQDMILNISASDYNQAKVKLTRDDCKSDVDFPSHIRFGKFLKQFFYFVWVRMGLNWDITG